MKEFERIQGETEKFTIKHEGGKTEIFGNRRNLSVKECIFPKGIVDGILPYISEIIERYKECNWAKDCPTEFEELVETMLKNICKLTESIVEIEKFNSNYEDFLRRIRKDYKNGQTYRGKK